MNYDFRLKPVRQFAEMMDRAADELDSAAWDASTLINLDHLGIAVEELDDAVFRDSPSSEITEKAVAVAIAAMMITAKV